MSWNGYSFIRSFVFNLRDGVFNGERSGRFMVCLLYKSIEVVIIHMGGSLQLRSTIKSNPLGVHNKVIITTWRRNAEIRIGNNFGMTGGAICSAQRIWIGDGVTVGANSTICDTDFHPIEVELRKKSSSVGKCKDIEIGDDVFVGMNCIILKGVHIKTGAVIGAGSVVSHNVPERVVVAGNPARIIRTI